MDNTVQFTIEGVGTFEFRPQLSHIEETKLELEIDKFLDYKFDELRERAFHFQNIAIKRILKDNFNSREISDLTEEEKIKLNELYRVDDSYEAAIAKKIFWELNIIEESFRLEMLKIKVPEGFDILKLDKDKNGLFFRILAEYKMAIEPIEQKKN